MKISIHVILFGCILMLLSNQSYSQNNARTKIANGNDTDIAEAPWQALMVQWTSAAHESYALKGGATIIGKRWVVTAAHILHSGADGRTGLINKSALGVVVGTDDKSAVYMNMSVKKIIIPSKYYSTVDHKYDIALLKLSDNIPFDEPGGASKYQAIPYNGEDLADLPQPIEITASGWGKNENNVFPNILQSVTFNILDDVLGGGGTKNF